MYKLYLDCETDYNTAYKYTCVDIVHRAQFWQMPTLANFCSSRLGWSQTPGAAFEGGEGRARPRDERKREEKRAAKRTQGEGKEGREDKRTQAA